MAESFKKEVKKLNKQQKVKTFIKYEIKYYFVQNIFISCVIRDKLSIGQDMHVQKSKIT